MLDDGTRVKNAAGAARENQKGKGEWAFIPYEGMRRTSIWFEQGAKKYGDRNWEKGLSIKDCCNSIARHLWKFLWGDNTEDHLAAIVQNAMMIMHFEAGAGYTYTDNVFDLPRYKTKAERIEK